MQGNGVERATRQAAILLNRGDGAAALARLAPLAALNRGNKELLRLTALALADQGQRPEAEEMLSRLVRRSPSDVESLRDLGVLLCAEGRWNEATGFFKRGLRYAPADPLLLSNLGNALTELGATSRAVAVLEEARRADPGHFLIAYRLAKALTVSRRLPEALGALDDCLRLHRSFHPALVLQARIHLDSNRPFDAIERLKGVLHSCPTNREAKSVLVSAYWKCGDLTSCLLEANELRQSGPISPSFDSFLVSARLHNYGETMDTMRSAAEEWASRYPAGLRPQPAPRRKAACRGPRRLRIGYLTHEFASGPAIHFILPLLKDANREGFEISVFHTNRFSDRYTAESRRLAEKFYWCRSEDEAARSIAGSNIDILVDVSGHYGNSLSLFQNRHAPVQITFPDYPGTTGAAEMDYILTDSWVCPEGAERQYTEKPIRLEVGYLPYNPPPAPSVPPLPALESGKVTFGLFQRPLKTNPAVWDAIGQILREVRSSRLLVHYSGEELDDRRSFAAKRLIGELEARGVSRHRLVLIGPLALRDHLALLSCVDIALDTFPYNGQTTTCECLWMGVPVVTLKGDSHVARVGYEILDRVGLGEIVASSAGEYVSRAVSLAADPVALAGLRKRLRSMVRHSPMVDGSTVRGIEGAYLQIWRRHE